MYAMFLLYQVRGPRWNRNILWRSSESDPENVRYHSAPRREATRRFPFWPKRRGKKPFHDARIPFSSLDLGGCLRDATGYICMIPENWTAPRLTGGIYSTVRSRRCTLVEKYMPPSRIVYESLPGVEGKLDYRRSNTESDQIARKGLHPSSLSVQRRRLPVTHAPPFRTILPADCKIPHSADRSPDEDIQIPSQTRSNHINRVDRSWPIIKWSTFIIGFMLLT